VKPNLGLRLRDKLGPDASQDLSQTFEEVQNHMLTITTERFEARLATVASEIRQDMARMDAGFRIALTEGLANIRIDMSESRIEIMRWSFFFWVGQFTATVTLIALLLRYAGR
jgi:hypothetical protein